MSLSIKQVARPRARKVSRALFEAVESRVFFTATPAKAADSFVDTIGVATHWNYLTPGNAYNDIFPTLKAKVGALGIRWMRDGVHPENSTALAHYLDIYNTYGIKTTDSVQDKTAGVLDQSKIAARLALLAPYADKLIGLEGPNEYNTSGDTNWAPNLRSYQQNLYNQIKAIPAFSSVPVIGPSLSQAPAYNTLGNISAYADKANIHHYAGDQAPPAGLGGWINAAVTSYGSDPIWGTETGYHNATAASYGISETAAGKYAPRIFLNYFQQNIERAAYYELVDETSNPANNNSQAHYGLLRLDGSEKPAYLALKNMISVLKDPGTPLPSLSSFDFGVSGADTGDIQRVLLQRRDGTFQLVLWRETSAWDSATKTDISVTPSPVTLSFNQPVASASVVVPGSGTTIPAATNYANPTSISLSVPDQVVVINITPASPAETVGDWNFDGSSGFGSSDTAAGSTASAITKGSRFASADGGSVQNVGTAADTPTNVLGVTGAFLVEGATTSTNAITTNSYYEFTITPGASPLNLTQLAWKADPVNDTIPMNFLLRSSRDGFAGNIASTVSATGAGWRPLSVDLSGATFQGLTTPTTFRLYVWETTGSSGFNRIDSIKLTAGTTTTSAQTLATYEFDNTAARTTPTTTATNATASNIGFGSRYATGATAFYNNAQSRDSLGFFGNFTLNTENNAVINNGYIEFTLTAAAGKTLDLSSLSFYAKAPSTGSAGFALASSLNSYATRIGTAQTTTSVGSFQKLTFDLSAATYNALTTVTFRLYSWDNATLQSDPTRIDMLSIQGTVV